MADNGRAVFSKARRNDKIPGRIRIDANVGWWSATHKTRSTIHPRPPTQPGFCPGSIVGAARRTLLLRLCVTKRRSFPEVLATYSALICPRCCIVANTQCAQCAPSDGAGGSLWQPFEPGPLRPNVEQSAIGWVWVRLFQIEKAGARSCSSMELRIMRAIEQTAEIREKI